MNKQREEAEAKMEEAKKKMMEDMEKQRREMEARSASEEEMKAKLVCTLALLSAGPCGLQRVFGVVFQRKKSLMPLVLLLGVLLHLGI